MLSGGKLADLFGRRRIFLLGLIIFSAASLACGLAPNAHFLIGARVVQGVGCCADDPRDAAIISATFPPRQRGIAIGIWAGVSAMALAIGPLVGGLITEHIDWSWIFFINVPVGILGDRRRAVVIAESRDTSHEQRLDLPGLVMSGGRALRAHIRPDRGERLRVDVAAILACFAIAAVGLATFISIELRQRAPMLDLSLFKNRHSPERTCR